MLIEKTKQNFPWQVFVVLAGLSIAAIYLAVHPFLSSLIGSITSNYAVIKIAKDIVVFLALLLVLLYLIKNSSLRSEIIRDPIIILIVLYAALHILLAHFFGLWTFKSVYAGLIFNLRFFALFLVVYILLRNYPAESKKLLNWFSLLIIIVGSIVAFFGILQVTVLPKDFMVNFGYDGINTIPPFSTIDDRQDALRAFSTLRTPNDFGLYLVLPICLSLYYFIVRRKSWMIFSFLIMLIGLYMSHSRTAFIGVLVAITFLLLMYYRKKLTFRRIIVLGITLLVMVGATLLLATQIPALRVVVFHSSEGDSSLTEGSTSDHFLAMKKGFVDVIKNPIGRGPGQAGPASFYNIDTEPRIAENYYIQIAQETGILGLILFILICGITARRLALAKEGNCLPILSALAGLAVASLLLHVWSDESVSYTWWAIAAIGIVTVQIPPVKYEH